MNAALPAPRTPHHPITLSPHDPVHVIGDVHGQLEKLVALLRDAGLIGVDWSWRGAESTLWLIGDLVDRGAHGIAVVELAMRLQREAAAAGGRVGVLFGNHDGLLLAASRFGATPISAPGSTFLSEWLANGGETADLERLTAAHIDWLTARPAMAREGAHLLVHADALFYFAYGQSIDEVNRAFSAILQSDDPGNWDQLLDGFAEHRSFIDGEAGVERAAAFLGQFGGRQIVHGHSPISSITRQAPEEVRQALVYAGGLCVDVDGGMYRGGPGFVYRLPTL
jgi:hypothetical protein